MPTAVAYWGEHGRSYPAINVKLHVPGRAFWPAAFDALPVSDDGCQEVGQTTAGDLVEAAYNIVQSDFWQAAEQIATERGLGEIAQEGRSGGWLVFTSGYDPQDCDCLPDSDDPCDDPAKRDEWLAGYRALSEWATDFLAAAPARVAGLAWRLALDEKGRAAAGGLPR